MTQSKGPVVDEARIARTYDVLGGMHVKLDPNPIEYGPKRFNNKIAETRALLTRLEQIFLQLSEDLHWFRRDVLRKKTTYELDKRNLLVKNMNVRAGRSQTERDTLADVELSEQLEELGLLEVTIQDLEMLMIVIKAKRTDLKDIQGRMRDQLKLIEHDISMNARWGHSLPPDPLNPTAGDDIDEILSNVDKEGGFSNEGDYEPPPTPQEVQEDKVEDHADPAPEAPEGAEEEPVIEFASMEDKPDEEDAEISGAIDAAIPQDGAEGTALEGSVASEMDVDEFLDSVSEDEEAPVSHLADDGPSIEDLISTLADDA